MGFDTQFDADVDARYEHHGVAVVTRKKMALHLDGTTIDFLDGPMGRASPSTIPASRAGAAARAAATIERSRRNRRVVECKRLPPPSAVKLGRL